MSIDAYRVFALSEDPRADNDYWRKAGLLAHFWLGAVRLPQRR